MIKKGDRQPLNLIINIPPIIYFVEKNASLLKICTIYIYICMLIYIIIYIICINGYVFVLYIYYICMHVYFTLTLECLK